MTFEIVFVLLSLLGMVAALVADKMRPGMILFSVVVLFLCAGILTPKEMLEGFSNKGMITVALLFLVSEGIRQSGTLGQVIKKLLPQGKTTVFKAQLRILPSVAFISAFLNNTPVVVIFAPIIKHWAKSVNLPATKFLIPLSYVTILGGICTLIGTSTNLVVHGMILEAGFEGFSMFELGKVGIFIAIAGIIYIFLFSKRLLPDARPDTAVPDEEVEEGEKLHRVEAVLGARFPGINKKLKDFKTLTGRNKAAKISPKLTAKRLELAQVESEIEKLLDTLTGASPVLLSYANSKIEELDARRQSIANEIAKLSADAVPMEKMESISGYLDDWENVSFEDKRQVVDALITVIRATNEKVEIEWKI